MVLGLDDTLERRWGRRIGGLGIYRDPVRSRHRYQVTCSGLKWVVMQVLVPLPGSPRPWGLPFFSVLAPSKAANAQARRHKTTVDWAVQLVQQVSRWVQRPWLCVADGGYGNLTFGWQCRHQGVSLSSRLRLDAHRYDFAPAYAPHRPGKPRTKGARLPTPQQRLAQIHASTPPGVLHPLPQLDPMALPHPQRAPLRWSGGCTQVRLLYSGTAVWAADGYRPLPIRWVLGLDPSGKQPPAALCSTNLALEPAFIVETFVARWSLEVTFQEVGAHLGFQTQRHWSKPAVQRTTPLILALCALTCRIAQSLQLAHPLSSRSTAWYHKPHLTFSALLEQVRVHLWQIHPSLSRSTQITNLDFWDSPPCQQLISLLASSL